MAMPENTAVGRNQLTSPEDRGNMSLADEPVNLENEISALPSVQADREYTSPNGCHVKMFFQYQSIKSWAAEFDRATPEQQKMILAKLIEKITVDRDYNIHIYFFVTQDEFRQSVSSEHTTVSEAERCEFAV